MGNPSEAAHLCNYSLVAVENYLIAILNQRVIYDLDGAPRLVVEVRGEGLHVEAIVEVLVAVDCWQV